jgi:predicted Zn-ribbon and HTH transcriptional regulator
MGSQKDRVGNLDAFRLIVFLVGIPAGVYFFGMLSNRGFWGFFTNGLIGFVALLGLPICVYTFIKIQLKISRIKNSSLYLGEAKHEEDIKWQKKLNKLKIKEAKDRTKTVRCTQCGWQGNKGQIYDNNGCPLCAGNQFSNLLR